MRTKTLTAALTAAALGLSVLAACSDDSPDQAAAGVDVPVDAPAVQLVEAGQGPREPLVWFSGGEEQRLTFRATQGLEQRTEGAGGDRQAGDDVPYKAVTMELPLTATASTDGETRTTDVTAGTPTGDNDALNADIASAAGFRISSGTMQNGRVTQRTLHAPEGASDSARASVESAFAQMNDIPLVFPDEAVGIGARWTVSTRVDETTSMKQDVTYTLVNRDGPHVTLRASVDRTPTQGTLPGSAEQAGQELKVKDVHGDSSGQLELDLTKALPVRGHVDSSTTVSYGTDDSPVRVVQTERARTEWAPAAP